VGMRFDGLLRRAARCSLRVYEPDPDQRVAQYPLWRGLVRPRVSCGRFIVHWPGQLPWIEPLHVGPCSVRDGNSHLARQPSAPPPQGE